VLVHHVMLDLTLNFLGHRTLARSQVTVRGPTGQRQRKRFWPTNCLKTTNKRSVGSDQQSTGTMKNGS